MDRWATVAIIVFFMAVMLGAMALSWWARKKRQSGYAELALVPTELGELLGEFSGLYLASTPLEEPLNRIAVRGLGFRARTTIEVFTAGLVFIGDRFVPAATIDGIGRASYTIDRGVEPDGLTVVSWSLGDAHIDSYFRLDDPEGFLRVASALTRRSKKQDGKK
jgi:hypothetical protein